MIILAPDSHFISHADCGIKTERVYVMDDSSSLLENTFTWLQEEVEFSDACWSLEDSIQASTTLLKIEKTISRLIHVYGALPMIETEAAKQIIATHKQLIEKYTTLQDLYWDNIDSSVLRECLFRMQKVLQDFQQLFMRIQKMHGFLYHPCPISREADPLSGAKLTDQEICIIGVVFSDGLGDYYNMLAIAESIHRAYPGQKIRMIFDFYGCFHLFSSTLQPPTWCAYTIFDELNAEKKQESASKLQEAALIIDGGVDAFDEIQHVQHFFYDYTLRTIPEKWIVITEPRSTGILGYGVHQEGLLVFPPEKEQENFDGWLKNFYIDQHDAAFCYVRSSSLFALSFMLCHLAYFKDSSKPLDLYMKWDGLLSLLQSDDVRSILKSFDIKTIHLYKRGRYFWETKEECLNLNPQGKDVRIINCFPIPHRQFVSLVRKMHSPFSGCTGDRSLAEVIGLGNLIPFYEILSHKVAIWEDYQCLAETLLGSAHPYCLMLKVYHDFHTHRFIKNSQNLTQEMHVFSEEMATLARLPECLKGVKQLHLYIMNRKNASQKIISTVQERLRK